MKVIRQFTLDGQEIGDWTFRGANTQEHIHCVYPYPARMIPQIARRLIKRYSEIHLAEVAVFWLKLRYQAGNQLESTLIY